MKFEYFAHWAEYFTILLMIIGFLIAITLDTMWLNYVVIFLAGMMAGRLLHARKRVTKFTHYLIIVGFLAGYLIGSYSYSRKIIAIIFIFSSVLSYYMHAKGYIEKYLPVYDPHRRHWK